MSGYCLGWAEIDWETPQTPRSLQYGDIYWSRDQGLAEKQHVFIEGNRLRDRFGSLAGAHFTLVETGFGFGLNFLLTIREWHHSSSAGAILNYIAVERSPVSPTDLKQCYERLGIRDEAATQLVEKMPVPVPGWHIIEIAENINLILGLGEAAYLLQDLDARVDCWYLDGFSPRVNPDAWSESITAAMASLSRPGATLTTYSVAGAVRRGAESAGFHAERVPGFGRKAEMLAAQFDGRWQPAQLAGGQVGIIGAGLAGLSLSHALKRRGISSTLVDAAEKPLAGASGSPALAVYPQLSANPELPGQFSLTAFCFAVNHYRTYIKTGRCQLAESVEAIDRFRQIESLLPEEFAQFLGAHEISERLSADCRHPGLYFDTAGHILAAAEFSDHEEFIGNQRVVRCDGNRITTTDQTLEFDAVVIATGHEELEQTRRLGRTPVRGQNITAELESPLSSIVGGPVSIVTLDDRRAVIGGTYAQGNTDTSLRTEETLALAARVDKHLELEAEPVSAWAGVRSSTRDRQPIVGSLPEWDALDRWCAGDDKAPFSEWSENLFTLIGLGSHGATTAPLLAETLARQISGEAGCLGLAGAARLNPARYALRDAGRRREVASLRSGRRSER